MQKAKTKPLLFEKQQKARKRSILAGIAPVPFDSVLVLSYAWTQWRFENLTAEMNSAAFVPHPPYTSDSDSSSQLLQYIGDVQVVRLLWLGVAKGNATIEVEGLSVFLSALSLFYSISLPKEQLLSILISATKDHAAHFTFVEALHFSPDLHFLLPCQASIDQSLECLRSCYAGFSWKDLFHACCAINSSITLPLLHTIVVERMGCCADDFVKGEDFSIFVAHLYEKPTDSDAVLKLLPLFKSSVSQVKKDAEPLTAGLALLNFLVMMERSDLTEYIRYCIMTLSAYEVVACVYFH